MPGSVKVAHVKRAAMVSSRFLRKREVLEGLYDKNPFPCLPGGQSVSYLLPNVYTLDTSTICASDVEVNSRYFLTPEDWWV